MDDLLQTTPRGLYCPAGDFFVDPWRPVDRAVLTHGHADHARWGMKRYLAAEAGAEILRKRLGPRIRLETLPYGRPTTLNGVTVSFHPAGHVLGSAQIRLEWKGRVTVVSGDYKLQPDPTCSPFEPVRAHTFITESTFGLPVYRWPDPEGEIRRILAWWAECTAAGRTAVLFAYSLGKAQRILASLPGDAAPVLIHGAVAGLIPAYRAAGVTFPELLPGTPENARRHRGRALVVAPPSAGGGAWIRKFGPVSTAFASGWMRIRGTRRRRAADRGFVLSDHVDWEGLRSAVEATGAERVGVTHGYVEPVVRFLSERGVDAFPVETRFAGEEGADEGEGVEPGDDGQPGDDVEPGEGRDP